VLVGYLEASKQLTAGKEIPLEFGVRKRKEKKEEKRRRKLNGEWWKGSIYSLGILPLVVD